MARNLDLISACGGIIFDLHLDSALDPQGNIVRIAVSVLGDLSRDDGTTMRAKHIFRALSKSNDVVMISRGHRASRSRGSIIIGPENTRLWNLKLVPIVLKRRFDCVYCSNDFAGFLTYWFFARIFGYKLVLETHGVISVEYERSHRRSLKSRLWGSILKWMEKFDVSHSDQVIALSKDVRDFYQKFNSKIEISPSFVSDDPPKRVVKVTKNGSSGRVLGLIGPFKEGGVNAEAIIFVLSNLDKFDNRIKFRVIGQCDSTFVRSDSRLEYTGYLCGRREYDSILAELDAVIVPARLPTFGPLTKILEPMSMGIPVFTTPVGAIGLDIAKANNNILIFDEDRFVDGVNTSLFDDELLRRIGEKGMLTVKGYYGMSINEARIESILRRLCEDVGPNPTRQESTSGNQK